LRTQINPILLPLYMKLEHRDYFQELKFS
jgi:hypothetical protein